MAAAHSSRPAAAAHSSRPEAAAAAHSSRPAAAAARKACQHPAAEAEEADTMHYGNRHLIVGRDREQSFESNKRTDGEGVAQNIED